MSDEQAMEIIENLSEELGEKELKIMALEKELEEQKKEKMEYYDLCQIRQYKIDFIEIFHGDDAFCPSWIICNNTEEEDDELMIKVLLHYFGGSIMNKEQIIDNCWDGSDAEWDDYLSTNEGDIVDLDNDTGNFWVSDNL
jgi:hypothetical protein